MAGKRREVLVEPLPAGGGGGPGRRERDGEDRVRAEAGLVRGAVKLAEERVDPGLLARVLAREGGGDLAFDVGDRALDPLAPKRAGSPSRSSTASRAPVEAPEGTAADPTAPPASRTSASTVGFPRESMISRARIASIRLPPRLDTTGAFIRPPPSAPRRYGPA